METGKGTFVKTAVLLIFIISVSAILIGGCQCKRKKPTDIATGTDEFIPDYSEEGLSQYPGDWLILGCTSTLDKINPFTASKDIEIDITSLLFNGLLTFDDEFNLVGDLAESFKIETIDGKIVVSILLKEGVQWHPYHDTAAGIDLPSLPLEPEDIQYTFDLIKSGVFGAFLKSFFSVFETVKKVDGRNITITLNGTSASRLFLLTAAVLPKKILEQYEDPVSAPFWEKPCGTGPFRFSRWEEDDDRGEQTLFLEAFESYFGGKPYLSGVKVLRVATSKTLFNLIQSERIDFARLPIQMYLQGMSSVQLNRRYDLTTVPGLSYTFVGFNLDREATPLFQNPKIRQALALAVNKQVLIDDILYGFAEPVNGPLSPTFPSYDPDITGIEYDIEKAKALLEDCGWQDNNNDGFLDRDSDGDGVLERFEVLLYTNKDYPVREEVAEHITSSWKLLGIDAAVHRESWEVLEQETLPRGSFGAVLIEWNHGPWPVMDTLWRSPTSQTEMGTFFSYSNSQVDGLLTNLAAETNQANRREIIKQLYQMIQNDIPGIFLYSRTQPVIIHRRFKGRVRKLSPLAPIGNTQAWFVPEKWQLSRD